MMADMTPHQSIVPPQDTRDVATGLFRRIHNWIKPSGPIVVGVCGPQGSGKTTACAKAQELLRQAGHRTITLSLDDFYLPSNARLALSRQKHPLFMTRGVPGTHDVALASDVLAALTAGRRIKLPRFDKATDNPAAISSWALSPEGLDVILFEGWCVGARPQEKSALKEPVNALEKIEDPDGTWRALVNEALCGTYQGVFSRFDRLCLLRAPHFDIVQTWREDQEAALRQSITSRGTKNARAMTPPEVKRFVSHYERLTRHIASEMPDRADLVIQLDDNRTIHSVFERTTSQS